MNRQNREDFRTVKLPRGEYLHHRKWQMLQIRLPLQAVIKYLPAHHWLQSPANSLKDLHGSGISNQNCTREVTHISPDLSREMQLSHGGVGRMILNAIVSGFGGDFNVTCSRLPSTPVYHGPMRRFHTDLPLAP